MGRCESICFDCKNAIFGCEWSRNFQPVDGWVALEHTINNANPVKSYIVHECPKFIPDEFKPSRKMICRMFNINDRTYFRWKNNGKLEKKIKEMGIWNN